MFRPSSLVGYLLYGLLGAAVLAGLIAAWLITIGIRGRSVRTVVPVGARGPSSNEVGR